MIMKKAAHFLSLQTLLESSDSDYALKKEDPGNLHEKIWPYTYPTCEKLFPYLYLFEIRQICTSMVMKKAGQGHSNHTGKFKPIFQLILTGKSGRFSNTFLVQIFVTLSSQLTMGKWPRCFSISNSKRCSRARVWYWKWLGQYWKVSSLSLSYFWQDC